MEKPFLFSFKGWQNDPPKYLLVYAETEEAAARLAQKQCFYNSGTPATMSDIKSCTFFT